MIFAPSGKDAGAWTLQEVSECGTLHFECTGCWKMSQFQPQPLMDMFGPNTTLGEIVPLMRCRRCGRKQAHALVRLYGWRGYKAWRPCEPSGGR